MNNNITINADEIRKRDDNSITDTETIRQIALYANKTRDFSLIRKIKNGYEFAGLYPEIMSTFNIKPEAKNHVMEVKDVYHFCIDNCCKSLRDNTQNDDTINAFRMSEVLAIAFMKDKEQVLNDILVKQLNKPNYDKI
jgi:hypothetical protein